VGVTLDVGVGSRVGVNPGVEVTTTGVGRTVVGAGRELIALVAVGMTVEGKPPTRVGSTLLQAVSQVNPSRQMATHLQLPFHDFGYRLLRFDLPIKDQFPVYQ
jgi:hypothetical protein